MKDMEGGIGSIHVRRERKCPWYLSEQQVERQAVTEPKVSHFIASFSESNFLRGIRSGNVDRLFFIVFSVSG